MTAIPSALEQAINAVKQDDVESMRKVLSMLMTSRVNLLLNKPWDGRSRPEEDTRTLFVSNGEDLKQPMLALFTSPSFAEPFQSDDSPYKHLVEVDIRFAIHRVEPGTGVMINPNSTTTCFRLSPELAKFFRDEIHKQWQATVKPGSPA